MQDKKTLLIVDDMVQIRDILRYSLKKEGFNVKLASNGYDALKIISENAPDLVILDVMMPKMDGYEVMKRIQNIEFEKAKKTPVLFLTAKAQGKDVLKGIQSGAVGYIIKPYKFPDLLKKVNTLLE